LLVSLPLKQLCGKKILITALLTGLVPSVYASDFIFPQGVYSGEDVKLTRLENGGKVNAALMECSKLTQSEKPEIVKIADGVWALVGYHGGYNACCNRL
jgi:hypothetical protein